MLAESSTPTAYNLRLWFHQRVHREIGYSVQDDGPLSFNFPALQARIDEIGDKSVSDAILQLNRELNNADATLPLINLRVPLIPFVIGCLAIVFGCLLIFSRSLVLIGRQAMPPILADMPPILSTLAIYVVFAATPAFAIFLFGYNFRFALPLGSEPTAELIALTWFVLSIAILAFSTAAGRRRPQTAGQDA